MTFDAMIRKSPRLSTKARVSYKEKTTLVLKQSRISKPVTQFVYMLRTSTAALNKQLKTGLKVEMENKEQKAKSVDILHEPHLTNAIQHFKKHDPKIAVHLENSATIEAFKERLSRADGSNPFKSLTKSIVYQKIHVKSAAAVYNRLIRLFDTSPITNNINSFFPTPEQLLGKSHEELFSVGLSTRKVEYIQNLAQKFVDHQITPDKFESMTDEEISIQLCQVKGIGQWSVDMFLMLDLHHPDILPLGDLVIRRGIAKHFGLEISSDPKTSLKHMMELTEIWRPYRTLGAWMMWYLSKATVMEETP